jgi:oligosaccharyltransferase complex subunit gamma
MILPVLSLLIFVSNAFAVLSFKELESWREPSGVIQLNDTTFFSLVTGPRDYYAALLFTATDNSINCVSCQKFDPIYHLVSKSYTSSNPGKDGIVFFRADFHDNQQVYNKLQMLQVPRLWVFPPSNYEGYNVSSPHFDYQIGDKAIDTPLDFADFVSKIVGANIMVQEDFELTQFLQYFVGTFVTVLLLKKQVLSKLAKDSIFKFLSVFAIVILTSGYMFTVIRGIPLLSRNEKGEIMYFSGGTHWQFGSETFIIASIYLGFVLLISSLVIYIPRVDNIIKRNTLTICASIGIFWLFNQLTSIYLIKDPDYPYFLAGLL